jgi:hypothetical protein
MVSKLTKVYKPSPQADLALKISVFPGEVGLKYWRGLGNWEDLSDVLPNYSSALADYEALKSNGLLHYNKEHPNIVPLDTPLTDEEVSRLRFGHSWGAQGLFRNFGPRWGRGLSLAFSLLPKEISKSVEHNFRDLGLMRCRTGSEVYGLLKDITALAKKHGDLLFKGYWKFLINWETLGGYLPEVEIDDFLGDLRQWVNGDIVHELPHEGILSEDYFLDMLTEGMEEFLSNMPNISVANAEAKTIKEFSSFTGNWASSGASARKERVMYYDSRGKRVRSRSNKWSTALSLDPQTVERVLTATHPSRLIQRNKAIQKREAGKVRAVVNSDDETYLRMSYISDWLETALHGHPLSTLFMSPSQLVGLWTNLSNKCRTNTVKIPLDQSHFDWQQNKRMISRFFDVLDKIIKTTAPDRIKDDLMLVSHNLRLSLVEFEGELSVGDEANKVTKLKIEKGIMSGWRWTALMDTVFNWGELYSARKFCVDRGLVDPIITATAQGDDDQVECTSYGAAAMLVEAYKVMNFEVNPSKFFVDTGRDEFLRQVSEPGVTSGYMVRGILSLLWRNPVSRDPPAGLLRMSEQVKGWNLVIGRGADKDRAFRLMLSDLSQGNGLSKEEVLGVLATPASVGGLGLINIEIDKWLVYKPGKITTEAVIDLTTTRGLRYETEWWKDRGIELKPRNIMDAIITNLDLPNAEKNVVAGTITERDVYSTRRHTSYVGGGGIPVQCPQRKDIPGVLAGEVLKRKIKDKDWDWVRGFWVPEELRSVSRMIEQRSSRRVWLSWILGKLPYRQPVVIGHSELQTSVVFDGLAKAYWSGLITRRWNVNWRNVESSALSCEYTTRRNVTSSVVRLGG